MSKHPKRLSRRDGLMLGSYALGSLVGAVLSPTAASYLTYI